MNCWYNDNERFCQGWLAELMKAGLVSEGAIDGRSITEIRPDEITADRCHFFAGIGGWDYALQLAGWPDNQPVWTGSCPCQPFSVAGKRLGTNDSRHLWPAWYELIKVVRPPVIFGEQVASRDGRKWLAGVRDDLEAVEYEVGAADLCAPCVGAPHIRQRLYWVGIAHGARSQPGQSAGETARYGDTLKPTSCGCMADSENLGRGNRQHGEGDKSATGKINTSPDDSESHGLANDQSQRRDGQQKTAESNRRGLAQNNFWHDSQFVNCRDGGERRIPTESALFPLAHGIPNRVGILRGAGNAIVPELAAEFIKVAMEYLNDTGRFCQVRSAD